MSGCQQSRNGMSSKAARHARPPPGRSARGSRASARAGHHETTVIVSLSVWMSVTVLFPPAPGLFDDYPGVVRMLLSCVDDGSIPELCKQVDSVVAIEHGEE